MSYTVRLLGLASLILATACTPTAPPEPASPTRAASTVPALSPVAAAPSPSAAVAVPSPSVGPTPIVGAARSPRVAVVAEPRAAAGQFPRTVRDVNGLHTIAAKPVRIHTLSVGYDEMTLRLVDPSRVVAIGSVTANADFSNVSELTSGIKGRVGRNSEEIVAQSPDLVVASPFANKDLLAQLQQAKVPLVIADLVSSVDAHEENIRFLAYLYGEEEKGEALIREVNQQVDRLKASTAGRPLSSRPSAIVLSGGQTVNAAGSGTTEGGILELAGARNAAAEAGVNGNATFALEALPDLKPDFIVVTEANPEKPTLLPMLRSHPVVGALPAFREGRVIVVKSSLMTTLSHWNVLGAEQLNRAFYPAGAAR